MRQIPTVSHYVSSYLANWRSYCRTEHFCGPGVAVVGRFALRFKREPGNAYFCSAKMRQIPTVSHYVSSYLANWRSYCRTEHFGGPKDDHFRAFRTSFKWGDQAMPGSIAQLLALSSLHSNCETGERLVLCRTKRFWGPKMAIFYRFVLCILRETGKIQPF